MSDYSIALYVHIAGALGLFAGLALEWMIASQLRRAVAVSDVQQALGMLPGIRRFSMISMLTLLAAGLYMMVTTWGGTAWLFVSLASLFVLILLTLMVTGRHLRAIKRVMDDGQAGQIIEIVHRPDVTSSIYLRVAVTLGIVFLMTIKPDLIGSVIAMFVFGVAGLLLGLLPTRTGETFRGAA